GEAVANARGGKPLVRLMPVTSNPPPRRLGLLAGTQDLRTRLRVLTTDRTLVGYGEPILWAG
ncbi:MAG: hypothetical protein ACKO45_05275, partial [Cyanobium sp.]